MTDKEMTELFSAMILAWPNADMFKGGVQNLASTIKLWATCTADVDFWVGQQTVLRLCKTCKYPPAIAEFRAQAETVRKDIQRLTDDALQEIRSAEYMYGSLEEFYKSLPVGNFTRAVIDTMGGPDALTSSFTDSSGQVQVLWNLRGVEEACQTVIRGRPALVDRPFPNLVKIRQKQ